MTGARGAEFGEIAPKNQLSRIAARDFITFKAESFDINNGFIQQVTPVGSFRLGQQIIFWWVIPNPVVTNPATGLQNWLTRVRFKLWWLRPNLEYRSPGMDGGPGTGDLTPTVPGWKPIDRDTFGAGPVGLPGIGSYVNNRYCWIPSPKRLDITPFQTPPPPAAPFMDSDSVLLDEIITSDLQDANLPAFTAGFSADQVPAREDVFFLPALGYALGVTAEVTYKFPPGAGVPTPGVALGVTWTVGTLGGTNYQESIG